MSINCVLATTSCTVEEICASVRRSPSLETGVWPVDLRNAVLIPCTHSCCSDLKLFRRARLVCRGRARCIKMVGCLDLRFEQLSRRGHESQRLQTVRRAVKL